VETYADFTVLRSSITRGVDSRLKKVAPEYARARRRKAKKKGKLRESRNDLCRRRFFGLRRLSLGLNKGGLSVRVAVDNDPHVEATYSANHPKTHLMIADVREVRGQQLLAKIPGGKLHVLAGCAPCQGFSSLTRKHKREDPRNVLVLEMARLVEETRPEIVVMENVPGLALHGRALAGRVYQTIARASVLLQLGRPSDG